MDIAISPQVMSAPNSLQTLRKGRLPTCEGGREGGKEGRKEGGREGGRERGGKGEGGREGGTKGGREGGREEGREGRRERRWGATRNTKLRRGGSYRGERSKKEFIMKVHLERDRTPYVPWNSDIRGEKKGCVQGMCTLLYSQLFSILFYCT